MHFFKSQPTQHFHFHFMYSIIVHTAVVLETSDGSFVTALYSCAYKLLLNIILIADI